MKQVGPYRLTKRIGKGHYAQVFKAINDETNQLVAVKCLQRNGISANQIKNIENEVLVLQKSNHPGIVSMLDRMRSKSSFYLVLEYCNGGDLASFISIVKRLPEEISRMIIVQIIQGMMHLHSLHVLHRDLKLANVLLHFPDMVGREEQITQDWLKNVDLRTQQFQIKIADLGFSKIQADHKELSVTYCGTPINMAPEVLNRGVYNSKADVWSLGTILFELLTGKSPFKDATNKEELKKYQKTVVIQNQKDLIYSKECLRFMNFCLTYNQYKRPSWNDLLDHNFIRLQQNSNESVFQSEHMLFKEDKKQSYLDQINTYQHIGSQQPAKGNNTFKQHEENIQENSIEVNAESNLLKCSSAYKNPFQNIQKIMHSKQQIGKTNLVQQKQQKNTQFQGQQLLQDSKNSLGKYSQSNSGSIYSDQQSIMRTVGIKRSDAKSVDSQELKQNIDDYANHESEWNVDVSSEEIDNLEKNRNVKGKPKKHKKLDLFFSCRNIVIKSASRINEHHQNSSSDNSNNNNFGCSPNEYLSQNFLSYDQCKIDQFSEKPFKLDNLREVQSNYSMQKFSKVNSLNKNDIASQYDEEIYQNGSSLKLPSQLNKFSTTESPFSIKSSDNFKNNMSTSLKDIEAIDSFPHLQKDQTMSQSRSKQNSSFKSRLPVSSTELLEQYKNNPKSQSSQSLNYSDFKQNQLLQSPKQNPPKKHISKKSKFYFMSIQNSCKSYDDCDENSSNQYNAQFNDDENDEILGCTSQFALLNQ